MRSITISNLFLISQLASGIIFRETESLEVIFSLLASRMKMYKYDGDTLRVAGQILIRVLQQIIGVQKVNTRVARSCRIALTRLFEEVGIDTRAPSSMFLNSL